MKIAALEFLYAIASSKRLAVGLMVYAAFLVFVATLAQREIGVAAAQAEYFESFFCVGSLGPLKFPLFGGALVGLAAVVNILASGWRYVSGGLFGFGASVAHMALVLLIVSGALQYFMRVEGSLVLREGMSSDTIVVGAKEGAAGEPVKLPFSVKLADFSVEHWDSSSTPKSFSSRVEFSRGENKSEQVVSMNSPGSFGGWTFYQMSYGDGGRTSVLSAVRNPARLLPWLAVGATFIGMAIMFLPRLFEKGRGGDE